MTLEKVLELIILLGLITLTLFWVFDPEGTYTSLKSLQAFIDVFGWFDSLN